jgi:FKBP-type peptidyl-prolyl cis-trans isomerase
VIGDTITTTTGLRYIEGVAGTGVVADWCQVMAIHYDAYFLDGTKFDSSRDDNQALVFTPGLGALIDGLEQGVIGMRVAGTRRLIIPPSLGFGSEPRRDPTGEVVIPGNSTLVYDIEMALIVQ